MTFDLSRAVWRKSSKSQDGGGCVEVAGLDAQYVAVRDSKNPADPPLIFRWDQWSAFLGQPRRVRSEWTSTPTPPTRSAGVDLSRASWHASPAAPTSPGRVEIADLGDRIAMRESTSTDGQVLVFTPLEWECFLDGVTKGEFPSAPTRR